MIKAVSAVRGQTAALSSESAAGDGMLASLKRCFFK